MKQETLNETLISIQNGNESAFDALYDNSKDILFYNILSIVKDRSLAEDLLQDTYLKILHNIHSYKANSNPIAWMLTIARNLSFNEYKRRKKDVFFDNDHQDNLLGSTHNDSIEQNPLIHTMYQVLKPKEIELIVLHVINGLNHKEIAKIVKRPLGTVLWQYQKALKKLKERIGEKNET